MQANQLLVHIYKKKTGDIFAVNLKYDILWLI